MHTAYALAIVRLEMTLSNSLQNNRVIPVKSPNIFLLPSFLNENVMLDFLFFWYVLVMFADQLKIYSAASTVHLIEKKRNI